MGGNGNPDAYKLLADPAVRRQMAEVIHAARRQDELAILHVEKALAK